MANIVVGLFETRNDAQAVQSALEDLGLGQDTTTVVQRGEADLTSRLVDAGIPPADALLFAAGVSQGHHLIMTQSIADDDVARQVQLMTQYFPDPPVTGVIPEATHCDLPPRAV